MALKELLYNEIIKNGYGERKDGRRVWNVANRSFLYMSPELVDSFLKLRAHPRYRATIINIEMGLLTQQAKQFIQEIGRTPCNLIDMGCGDGKKAKVFLDALKGEGKIRFCPVSPSSYLVEIALKNVQQAGFSNVVGYEPHVVDLNSLHQIVNMIRNKEFKKNLILLLGSILASFDIHEYLFNLSQSMVEGDCLIIGNAIRTGDRFTNIANYTHPIFQEWTSHIMKALGFKESEILYGARFENGRVEIFYTLRKGRKISHEGREIKLRKNDDLIVGILYKYYANELEKFCKMYFRNVYLTKDSDEEQALIYCIK